MPSPASEQTTIVSAQRQAQSSDATDASKKGADREGRVVVAHADGLHARPAAMLVKLARSFASDVEIECRGRTANAKSSVKIMLLAVKENDEVTVRTRGADAGEAFARIAEFLKTEEKPSTTSTAPTGAA